MKRQFAVGRRSVTAVFHGGPADGQQVELDEVAWVIRVRGFGDGRYAIESDVAEVCGDEVRGHWWWIPATQPS